MKKYSKRNINWLSAKETNKQINMSDKEADQDAQDPPRSSEQSSVWD